MFKQEQNKLKKVQLAEGVFVYTPLDDVCIPALRSGFAGYPVNPRWNAMKFHAWKMGRQWRDAVVRGEMIVRSTDSLLIPIHKTEESTDSLDPHELLRRTRRLPSQVSRPTPAIALTSYDSAEHRRRAIDAGFDAYLARPLDPDALVGVIARLVSARDAP